MDNYLDHRWPKGPGVQPPPVPSGRTAAPRKKRGRSPWRWLAPLLGAALCLVLLGGVCFWAVNCIADMLAQIPNELPDDPRPWASRAVELDPISDWTPEDLPWGSPDPSVALSTSRTGPALSGREVYQEALSSLVCVEAAHTSPFDGLSTGTGIVVAGSGYVVTNYHIIEDALSIQVQLLAGPSRYFDASVIGFDEGFDLAVLKFDPDGVALSPARLGDSDELAVGDRVYALGNPMGYLRGSMSTGVVSALDRDDDASGSPLGLIQTDAALNPGSSGGALLNESGQVVGITCAKITGLSREGGEPVEDAVVLEGMGLAIPISDAIPFLNHILATGESWRPAMGITCVAAEVDGRQGIQVRSVDGSAAREAGLRRGDLILAANGVDTTTLAGLRRVLYRAGAEEEVSFTVLRGGQELEISFPLMDSLKQDQG